MIRYGWLPPPPAASARFSRACALPGVFATLASMPLAHD
jgi:hypothetical protein